MNKIAKYNQETRDYYIDLLKDKPVEMQIKCLEEAEREKDNYYFNSVGSLQISLSANLLDLDFQYIVEKTSSPSLL